MRTKERSIGRILNDKRKTQRKSIFTNCRGQRPKTQNITAPAAFAAAAVLIQRKYPFLSAPNIHLHSSSYRHAYALCVLRPRPLWTTIHTDRPVPQTLTRTQIEIERVSQARSHRHSCTSPNSSSSSSSFS